MKRYRSVDNFFEDQDNWKPELEKLRKILLSTGMDETLKWSIPYYTYQGKNVVGISAFKSYFGLWFTQGALLNDEKKLLMNAQEGTTRAMRQWRMQSASDIKARTIKAYVKEALSHVDAGKEIKARAPSKTIEVPTELQTALKKNKAANTKFKAFPPFKQKEFALYITGAKRAETKQKRLEKILPMILDGVGLNDKYR